MYLVKNEFPPSSLRSIILQGYDQWTFWWHVFVSSFIFIGSSGWWQWSEVSNLCCLTLNPTGPGTRSWTSVEYFCICWNNNSIHVEDHCKGLFNRLLWTFNKVIFTNAMAYIKDLLMWSIFFPRYDLILPWKESECNFRRINVSLSFHREEYIAKQCNQTSFNQKWCCSSILSQPCGL